MAQKTNQIALLLDYDNLMGFNGKSEGDANRNYSHPDVVNYLETHYGSVVYCKAFGDWTGPRTRRTIGDLAKAGAEMQFIPHGPVATRIPGFTAACMGLDALDLISANPNITGVVFGINDMALIPFITRIHAAGRQVFILGPEPAAAAALTRISDEFISLQDGGMRSKAPNTVDKAQVLYNIKSLLVNGEMPLSELEEKISAALPEFTPGDFGCSDFEEFLRNIANTTVKLIKGEEGAVSVALGNCHNASAYSDEELASFNLAEYMQATRWHIADGDIRDKVLHNIYVIFSEGKGREMTNDELRNTVDPDHVVEDRPWQGTIWSLIFGACLWENPKTSNQPQSRRLLSLFRTVTSEDDFLVRYYTSLFKKAFEDRPGLTPQACAELMHSDNAEAALPLFERVFQNLKNPVLPKLPAASGNAAK
ncbi:MAG: NYN domain-containing protein [Victivallales bacterium]|nr:NYN domain-containing protein [Victivallales bacterium]